MYIYFFKKELYPFSSKQSYLKGFGFVSRELERNVVMKICLYISSLLAVSPVSLGGLILPPEKEHCALVVGKAVALWLSGRAGAQRCRPASCWPLSVSPICSTDQDRMQPGRNCGPEVRAP